MNDLKYPTIHMNGTSGDELFAQNMNALVALRAAYEALLKATPNGRDYYVQSPGAITRAVDQHGARLRRLQDVIAEVGMIVEEINTQIDARAVQAGGR